MEPLQLTMIVLSFGFTAVALVLTARAVAAMLGVIRIGQPAHGRTDNPASRAITVLKESFLHTRMLQWTWVGILHWFAFAAFLFLSTAVGAAFFQLFDPEFAIPLIGHWVVYEWAAEFIGLLGALAIIPLIIYRVTHTPAKMGRRSRFFGSTMWQAYFVEFMVLLESAAILFIRGAEWKLFGEEEAGRGHFPISGFLGDALYPSGAGALENIIFIIAAIKIVSAMIWLIVISSNLTMGVAWHRFTAWFNIYFKRESSGRTALGAIKPMTSGGEVVNFEDLEDMDEDTKLGVGAVEDFSWKGILDFTTCTECGRCQSQCPAWNTEKPLSPKLLMMGLREHAYEKAPYLNAGSEEARAELDAGTLAVAEKSLIGKAHDGDWFYNPEGGDFVIDEDVLWSCTSCGACVQQCPVDIEHVDHIMDMRRYQILVESNFPAELNGLFKGLENKGNPWNMSPKGRMEWAQGLEFDVPVLGETAESMDDFEWLFWVGCAGAYEDRAKKTTRAVAELLNMADVKFAVLGNGETCTGDPARRAGNEFVFQGLATQNAETFKEMKVKKVVSTCAHCFNTLKNEYQEFGVELEVVHHTQLLNRLVREKKLTPVAAQGAEKAAGRSITYHDPCYLGRHNQVYSPPRELLQVIPDAEVKEMPRNSEKSFCCGAGGARMWMEETIGERINVNRTKEAVETGADQIAVGCPFCRVMLSDGLTAQQSKGEAREEVEVLDVAQLLLASVKGEAYAPKKSAGAGAAAGAGAGAAAASADVAAKAEPSAGDATQTENTVTDTEDVGPNAKASGGSSLFDTPAAEEKPAESGGSSLFDTPAPEESTPAASAGGSESGGSLFDDGGSLFDSPGEAAASEETAQSSEGEVQDDTSVTEATDSGDSTDLGGGGSLFDIAGDQPAESKPAPAAEEPAGEDAAGDSTTDGQVDRAKDDADTDVAPEKAAPSGEAAQPASSVPEGGSLFDIEAPEPAAAPAAPAASEPSATPEATEPAGEDAAADSTTDGNIDRAQDDADTDVAPEKETEQPEASAAEPAKVESTPAASIPEGGSLFDIEAPEPAAAPAAPAASEPSATPEAAEPAGEDAAADSTTDGNIDRAQDDADTDVAPSSDDAADAGEEPIKSLHQIKAEASGQSTESTEAETAPDAEPAEEPAVEEPAVEQEAAEQEEPQAEKPKPASSGESHQPATDKDIGGASSLFDL